MATKIYDLKDRSVIISLDEYNDLLTYQKAIDSNLNIKIITIEQDTYDRTLVKLIIIDAERVNSELINGIEVIQKALNEANEAKYKYQSELNQMRRESRQEIIVKPKKWWQL